MRNIIESICELLVRTMSIVIAGTISLAALYLIFFPITVPLTILLILILI